MNEFNQMFQQAVAIKSHEMHSKRKVFEKQPLFIKAGLYYLNEYSTQRKLQFEERFEVANELKEKGNSLFKEGKYSAASHQYEKSLSIFMFIENRNPNWKNEGIVDDDLTYVDEGEDERVKDLKIKSLLNLTMCYIKEKQWKDAIAACDYVLAIGENAKAYFRRAKVFCNFSQARIDNINSDENDYKLAIDDFEKALTIEDDEIIRKELTKAKLELKKMMRSNVEISQNVIKNIQKTAPVVDEQSSSSEEEEDYEYSEDWKKYAFNTLNYEPSYEEDQNIAIPEEIIEFGKFIETRGVQLLQIYETSQKIDEADKHRQFLSQLMAAKVKIERISQSNFSKPIINEKATQFGIDLSDPGVQEEFKTLLEQNLRDLRKWLKEQNWKLRKQKIIKNVSKLAEKEKFGKLDQETGKNNAFDWIVLGICAMIIVISFYF